MFIDFFYELRDEKVPVGTQEWRLLLSALEKGLHGSSLQHFYHLARCVLVKSETRFDAFNRAFLKVFEGVEGSLDIEDELLEANGNIDPRRGSPTRGIDWLQRIRERFERVVWQNPEPPEEWRRTPTVQFVERVFPMFHLSVDGIGEAVSALIGARVAH